MIRAMRMPTEGVQSIGGAGLVRLANWTTRRHDSYKKFMARIHKFIVAITSAEKEERENAAVIEKATLGYDPNKAIKSNGSIRKEDSTSIRVHQATTPTADKRKAQVQALPMHV